MTVHERSVYAAVAFYFLPVYSAVLDIGGHNRTVLSTLSSTPCLPLYKRIIELAELFVCVVIPTDLVRVCRLSRGDSDIENSVHPANRHANVLPRNCVFARISDRFGSVLLRLKRRHSRKQQQKTDFTRYMIVCVIRRERICGRQ